MSKKGKTKVPGTYLLYRLAKKHLSPGVTDAATERPLERVAKDPTGVSYIKDAHSFEWA